MKNSGLSAATQSHVNVIDRRSYLDRLADILLADNARGYLIRLITEPLPIFILWSLGDLLGFLTGWRDYRHGLTNKGYLKMLTAAIPGVPTIPIHIVVDKLFPSLNRS